jgi:hypothetical protein
MKKTVFREVAPCTCGVNRRFGGTFRLHLRSLLLPVLTVPSLSDFLIFYSTLKMEAIRSFETSVNTTSTRCYFPEDCFLYTIYLHIAVLVTVEETYWRLLLKTSTRFFVYLVKHLSNQICSE